MHQPKQNCVFEPAKVVSSWVNLHEHCLNIKYAEAYTVVDCLSVSTLQNLCKLVILSPVSGLVTFSFSSAVLSLYQS